MVARLLVVLPLAACPALSQSFSFGVKGGVPLTDFLETGAAGPFANYKTHTNRYVIGGTAELRLSSGFSIELDVLYRHLNFSNSGKYNPGMSVFTSAATAGAWEFPLLARYRLPSRRIVRPFVSAGIAVDTVQGLSESTTVYQFIGGQSTTVTSQPGELASRAVFGLVMGAGLDAHLGRVHVMPEFRYTNWTRRLLCSCSSTPLLSFSQMQSNPEQVEFLLGISF